jgi:signal transduction histidine kinase
MDLGALPAIRCRGARVHQVVVNLLMNAIDACEAGGAVTIRTRADPEIEGLRIEVADTGCGIDPAIRERIFDPFFTTKPVGQGTGLGLSISYGIVQEHGGTIEVQSSPGAGSSFTVRLPVQPARARNGQQSPAAQGVG